MRRTQRHVVPFNPCGGGSRGENGTLSEQWTRGQFDRRRSARVAAVSSWLVSFGHRRRQALIEDLPFGMWHS
uniref:Uncharacterized protein n=1 Tax=Tetraselmis sp. GSL018 TaxID=582737 RepID=A0A061SIC6_9CHLO